MTGVQRSIMCREGHGGWGLALLDALEFWLDILHIIVMGLFCLFDGQPGKCHGATMSCPRVSYLWPCSVGYHFVKLNKPSLTFFSAESFMTFSLIRSSHQLYSETESEWKAPFLILQFFGWKLFFLLKKDTLQSLTSYLMYWYGQSVQSYGTWQSCQTGTCFRVYNLRSRINWGE